MKVLQTFAGSREVSLIEKRPIGRKPRRPEDPPQEKRYAIYLDAKTEYAWFRRRKHAEMCFEVLREVMAEIPRNP